MKIKVTPIKNDFLCERCEYAEVRCVTRPLCKKCGMYNNDGECICTTIKQGQPCPFFKLSKKGSGKK